MLSRNNAIRVLKCCARLKIYYYKTLDIKSLMDNRKFWKTAKPLFSNKMQAPPEIARLENEVLVTDGKEVAEIFNEYFVNITDSLGIIQPKDPLRHIDEIHDLFHGRSICYQCCAV